MMALAVKSSLRQGRESLLPLWWPLMEAEVRRYAMRGGPAEDLRGEGALALWEALVQYDPIRHRTTMDQYIRNHVHRRIRRAYMDALGFERPKEVPLAEASPGAVQDGAMEQVLQQLDLNQALAELPEQDRRTLERYFKLVCSEDAGPDEAARRFAAEDGVSFASWKKRLERSRKKLRAKL